jgi:hypothetical protein
LFALTNKNLTVKDFEINIEVAMSLQDVVQAFSNNQKQEKLKAAQERALKEQDEFYNQKELLKADLEHSLRDVFQILLLDHHGEFATDSHNKVTFQFRYLRHGVTLIPEYLNPENPEKSRYLIKACRGSLQSFEDLLKNLLQMLVNIENSLEEFHVSVIVYKRIKAIDKDLACYLLAEELEQHGFEAEVG